MGTTATLELTHKGNINDKTILERDREIRDFNVTLLASAIARRRHLVIDTHRTDLEVTRQGCHYIHEMIVTANPAASAAGRDGDGIMLASVMAERAPGQSLPVVAGAVPRDIPRCIPSALLSSLAHHPQIFFQFKSVY